MPVFYTYLWLREDGTPYYVGKGSGDRATQSTKYHRPPKDKSLILIQDFPTEEDAFSAEKFLVEYYGRKETGTGPLINRTDGGKGGMTGYKHSKETREKISKNFVGRRGKPCSAEHKEKLSKARSGLVLSTQWRQRISESQKGHPSNKGMTGKKHSAESIQKMRDIALRRVACQRLANAATAGKQ